MRWRGAVLAAAFLVLPGVVLFPAWRLGGLGAGEDDLLYYYPSRAFFRESLQAGRLPWLNPWTGLDRPYVADPQSAVFYPTTWLFAVLPTAWGYGASLWLHYSLALWGAYRLLRARGGPYRDSSAAAGVDWRAALFGAVAFAFCGFLLAHRTHFTMQHGAAWMPWVFWRMRRYAHEGGVRRLVWVALPAALQCLSGHVQMAALTALGTLVFLWFDGAPGGKAWRSRAVARWALAWICAAGLFAVQLLPTLDYLALCSRADRGLLDFLENSWNPLTLVAWVMPMLLGQRTPNFFAQRWWGPSHQVEQIAYIGILPLLLAVAALRGGWWDTRRRAWIALAAFALLLALGQFAPLAPLLYLVPGSNVFRVPARALLLVDLAAVALAAVMVHDLGAAVTPYRVRLRALLLRWTRRPLALALAAIAICLGASVLVVPWLSPVMRERAWQSMQPWRTSVWVPLVVIAASAAALRFALQRWRQPRWLWLLPTVLLVDLSIIGWTIDVPCGRHSAADFITDPRAIVWLEEVRDSDERLWVVTPRPNKRVFPGEYIEPLLKRVANTNLLVHVKSLTDYGPLQPETFRRYFGFEYWGETDRARELLADTSWARRFNVGWILLCEPTWPPPTDCELVTTTPEGLRLFRCLDVVGPAYFANPAQPGAVNLEELGPDQFRLLVDTWPEHEASETRPTEAARQGWPRVVVARLALPGWQAQIDGQRVPLETANEMLLAVRVPPGPAVTVSFSYFPPGLRVGAALSIAVAAVLVIAACWPRRS